MARITYPNEDHPAVASYIRWAYCEDSHYPLSDAEAQNEGSLQDAIAVLARLPRDRQYATFCMDDEGWEQRYEQHRAALGAEISEESFPGSVFAQWLYHCQHGSYFVSADYNVGGADCYVMPVGANIG